MTNDSNSKNIKCIVCGKAFSDPHALNQHRKAMGHKAIKCPHCEKSFDSQQGLQQHIVSVHKKHNCPNCSKTFKYRRALEQHINSVQTQHKCPYCDKILKKKQSLTQHISDAHEFKCPHCSLNLNSRILLKKHIEETHKDKLKASYICHECKRVFKNQDSLDQHLQSLGHQFKSISNLNCPQCKKKFKDKNALKNHLNSTGHKLDNFVAKSTKFKCPHCQKDFKTEKSMNQHILMKHKKQTKKKAKREKLELALFEKISIKEKITNFFRKRFNKKRIVVMDECVGNDSSVIKALKGQYSIHALPKELISHSDKDLRLALSAKKWGLVSKDYEMVMLAREMKIIPVYLLTEKRNYRDLIRISKRNYKIN